MLQVLGHKLVPVRSVGAYIPGGRYPLISSALMSILTAKVAGVERVVAMAAPTSSGSIHGPTLYAMSRAGVDEIYALGGVQAMGAMAYGALDGLDPVDMSVGAGNAFVAEAKRQLFGRVCIDLLAGPTEVLVIADDTADAHTVAVDLLAQAEHGPTSPAVLITTSRELGVAVIDAIPAILQSWPTGDVAGEAWADLGVVAVVDLRVDRYGVRNRAERSRQRGCSQPMGSMATARPTLVEASTSTVPRAMRCRKYRRLANERVPSSEAQTVIDVSP